MKKKIDSFLKKIDKTYMLMVIITIAIVFVYYYYFSKKYVKESFSDNKDSDCIVRMFYVNWCGYCKKTKPDFQTFMEQNNNTTINGKKVKIEMIDCEENEQNAELASQFNVKSYPTIIAVVNGKPQQYEDGDRSVAGLNTWLQSLL
jgi:thiol-disulfide isomerase/thioredoxin